MDIFSLHEPVLALDTNHRQVLRCQVSGRVRIFADAFCGAITYIHRRNCPDSICFPILILLNLYWIAAWPEEVSNGSHFMKRPVSLVELKA